MNKHDKIFGDVKQFIECAVDGREIPSDVVSRVVNYNKIAMLDVLIREGAKRAASKGNHSGYNMALLNLIRTEAAEQGKELTTSQEMELIDKMFTGKLEKTLGEELKSDEYKSASREPITEWPKKGFAYVKQFIDCAVDAREIPSDVVSRVVECNKIAMLEVLIREGAKKAVSEGNHSMYNMALLNLIRTEAAGQGKELTASQEMELLGKMSAGGLEKPLDEELKSDRYRTGKRESKVEGVGIDD